MKLKQGEAKTLSFTARSDGDLVDVSTGTFSLLVKAEKTDTSAVISKSDGDFDKTDAADGVVRVNFSATDTAQTPGEYIMELKCTLSGTNIDKSTDFQLVIVRSL